MSFYRPLVLALAGVVLTLSSQLSEPLSVCAGDVRAGSARDRLESLLAQAKRYSLQAKSRGEPSQVSRSAKPELLLSTQGIQFDGRDVKLGDSLSKWKQVIGGSPRCSDNAPSKLTLCVWDLLGLELVTAWDGITVDALNLYLNNPRDPFDGLVTTLPDGSPVPARDVIHPASPFKGYVALEGYGIDTNTKFWEIRRSVSADRNLRCGLRNCEFPHGNLGPTVGIYLRLNGRTDDATVYTIELSKIDTYK